MAVAIVLCCDGVEIVGDRGHATAHSYRVVAAPGLMTGDIWSKVACIRVCAPGDGMDANDDDRVIYSRVRVIVVRDRVVATNAVILTRAVVKIGRGGEIRGVYVSATRKHEPAVRKRRRD